MQEILFNFQRCTRFRSRHVYTLNFTLCKKVTVLFPVALCILQKWNSNGNCKLLPFSMFCNNDFIIASLMYCSKYNREKNKKKKKDKSSWHLNTMVLALEHFTVCREEGGNSVKANISWVSKSWSISCSYKMVKLDGLCPGDSSLQTLARGSTPTKWRKEGRWEKKMPA